MPNQPGKGLAASIGRRLRETYSDGGVHELPRPIADKLTALREAERRSSGDAGEDPPAEGGTSDDSAPNCARDGSSSFDGSSGQADASF